MTAVTNSIASTATDIRDIKPPIGIYSGWVWFWGALGAVVVLATLLAVLLFFLMRKKLKPVPPVVPAHVRAKQKLTDALALISQPKPFVIAVSDASRSYLEERFRFRAPERTTEEFLRELNATDLLSPEQKGSLGRFLENCDLVKFAKYEPGESELRGLHSSAIQLVEETKPVAADQQQETSPNGAQASAAQATSDSKGKKFAVVGALFQLALLIIGIGGAVFSYRVYHSLSDSISSNTPDKTEFAAQMEMMLNHYLWLVLLCTFLWLAGLVLLVISLVRYRYRARWFFWFLIVYGIMMLAGFPLGTLFGAFVLIYCLTKRNEFLNL